MERGEIRVGTTADYSPFTYRVKGEYLGYDVDLARLIATELGVQVRFVPTTWSEFDRQLRSGEFDLALGGITRTLKRQTRLGFTDPTFVIGKCPLVRKEDAAIFTSLERIDRSDVVVAVNPGGTNEGYVRQHIKRARVILIEDNLAIPGLIAKKRADVMLTDNLEALKAAREDPRLAAVSPNQPWTSESLGLVTQRDDQAFLNWLNLFLYQAEADGRLTKLRQKYGL